MDRRRLTFPLLCVALFATMGFAGCLGEDAPAAGADDDAAAQQGAGSDAASEGNVTVDDGTAEMPKDLGAMPHAHDYWMGKERITLLDQDVKVDAFNALYFSFVNVIGFRSPAVGGAFVELPDGAIVFEGTGKLEFTPSWSDPTVTGMTLRYRSAAGPQFSEPQPLNNGETVTIDVAPEMSDMPHEKTSRWSFLLTPGAGQAMVGTFHVKVDIVKMHDIESFPGHPELFGGERTLTLYEGPAQSSQTSFPRRMAEVLVNGFRWDNDGVRSAKVVPMETMSMTANVTITSATATLGKVSGAVFLVKPADRNQYMRATTIASDPEKGVYQFAWLVEMAQTDSPYAKESQWSFDLHVQTDTTGTGQQCGGCSDAQVDYQLAVVAYDGVVEGAEELEGGMRGGDDEDDR